MRMRIKLPSFVNIRIIRCFTEELRIYMHLSAALSRIVLLAGVNAQPVLIGDAVGVSWRVIPAMFLHTACLTANGDGRWSRVAGSDITMKILWSSFGLGGGPDRGLAGFRGRLLPLSFGMEISGSLATSAQGRRPVL